MLGSYIAMPCGDICTGSHKAMIGSDWKYKKVFGISEFGELPLVWTSVYISVSKAQRYMEVNINGEKVGRTDRYITAGQ